MKRNILTAVAAAALLTAAWGCGGDERAAKISLKEREAETVSSSGGRGLRVALGGIITPKEGLTYYRNFLNRIEKKLGLHVSYVDKEDYGEINRMLKSGELDMAFVCSGPYVDGHAEFGLELLAAPEAYGKASYNSYIIVPKGSHASSLKDLRGKSFAFMDPLSNTGFLVPTFMLAEIGETPKTFFSNTTFTHGHDKSIRAVAEEIVDGAAVDSLIWEYQNRLDPRYTTATRIIARSPEYAIPPVAVRPGLDPGLKARLKEVFLTASDDEEGRGILRKMMIDRFVTIDDDAYDSIRQMKKWLDKRQGTGASAGGQ